MAPTEPQSRARSSESDEVDEYIRARRRERVRRSSYAVRQDVLSADAEFTWEMPAPRHRSDGGEVSYAEVLELTIDDAWRAAAAARQVDPRAVDRSLDEWGDRIAEPDLRPVAAPDLRRWPPPGRARSPPPTALAKPSGSAAHPCPSRRRRPAAPPRPRPRPSATPARSETSRAFRPRPETRPSAGWS